MRSLWRRFKYLFKKKQPKQLYSTQVGNNEDAMSVDIHYTKNFTKDEIYKFTKAMHLLVKVINSTQFRTKVIHAELESTNGFTNLEIYNRFMSGVDMYNKDADNDIDISITMYNARNNVVGYTFHDTPKTWINRKFFKRFSTAQIVGNCVHEYMHNMGFKHKSTRYSRSSVPYLYGSIAKRLAQSYIAGMKLYPTRKQDE